MRLWSSTNIVFYKLLTYVWVASSLWEFFKFYSSLNKTNYQAVWHS